MRRKIISICSKCSGFCHSESPDSSGEGIFISTKNIGLTRFLPANWRLEMTQSLILGQRLICIFLLIFLNVPATAFGQQRVPPQIKMDDQRYRIARQYEVAGRYHEALQIFQSLWDADPRNMNYFRGVKNNLLQLKRFPEAILAAEKMLRMNNSIYVEADLGEIYYQMGEKDKAHQIWDAIITRNKTQVNAYQAVAAAMLSNRLVDEAIKLYETGRENLSNQSLFLIELANLYHARLDYQKATLMYLNYLDSMPKQFAFVEGQISKLAQDIEEDEPIIDIIKKELKTHQQPLLLRKLLANLYMRSSNYEQALEQYQFLDENDLSAKKEARGGELFDFAYNALNDGAYQFAEQAFQILIARYADSPYVPRAQLGLAEALDRQKKYTGAIAAYETIIQQYPRNAEAKKAYLQIGEIKLNQFNDPNGAKESFQVLLKNFPFSAEHFQAIFKIAECEIRSGSLESAQDWYQKAINYKNATDDIKDEAQYKLALIDFWKGDFDVALSKLEQMTQIQPILRKGRSDFYVNDALELSIFINENKGQLPLLKEYAKSLLLIEQHSYPDALNQLKNLFDNNPQSPLADDILLKMGEIENRLQQFQAAIDTYQLLIKNYPESLYCAEARKRIGDIYKNEFKNVSQAIQEYEMVLANYPESLLIEEVRKNIRELESTGLR